jgi:CMP-N,N'-diacetyllegionaminic acid synthase
MIENLKVLAIIPARGGSKGLKGKNIAPINGLPLIAYSIKAAKESKYVDLCLVSSDSQQILDIAKTYGSETLRRPDELASDTASSESAVTHVLSAYPGFDLILLLQPTSPQRTSADIDAALELLIASEATALLSVYEPKHTPYKCFKISSGGFLEGLIDSETPFMRRQDLPVALMPNGAIYIIFREEFLLKESLLSDKTIPYFMSEERSIDIDLIEDLAIAAELLDKKTNE